jgi:hypothetical protein
MATALYTVHATIYAMEPSARAITWEGPEHHHIEKGNDWYFALFIIVIALCIVAVMFGNALFAMVIGLAGGALALSASKRPAIIPYGVTVRGVRIDDRLYPFPTLAAYHIDEEDPRGPQLLLRAKRSLMPLLVLPLPSEYIDDIEDLLREQLPQEELEEPLLLKVLELFGF